MQNRTSLIELLRKMAKALTEGEFLEAVRCLEECDEWKIKQEAPGLSEGDLVSSERMVG